MPHESDLTTIFPSRRPRWAERYGGLAVFLAVVTILGLVTSVYTVGPEELGVIRRFGAFQRTTSPGLHLRLPFGIEVLDKVPVQRQLKEEFGFRTQSVGVQSTFTTRGYEDEALMLTGDLNIASVAWIVQYRITDPYRFLFRVRDVRATLRDLNEAVVREVVGDRTINEVLTVGRNEVATKVHEKLQELANQYEMGVSIDQVVLQDVNPPEPVKPSFNEVNEAQQEREKLINEARAEYNRVIPRAKGDAERIVSEARAYALERVNRARGEASRFDALYEAYAKAPEVTRRRIYLETLHESLPRAGHKVVTDPEFSGVLPFLPLGGDNPLGRGGGQ